MYLGAHLSIGGGLHNALLAAHRHGFNTCAMFVGSHRQWRSTPLTDDAAATFRRVRRELGIGPVLGHSSYLINLAGEEPVRGKSVAAIAEEIDRCERLGLDGLVLHPGSCADLQTGIARIAEALNAVVGARKRMHSRVLLETTAGAGSVIGDTFEELAALLALLRPARRFGVCMDTCHVFAAGYDIVTRAGYKATMADFDRVVGLPRLGGIHVNDSLRAIGSHADRHAHIGHGMIGLAGFANFVNDRRMADVPLILETPKETTPDGQDWDDVNAQTLRGLVGMRPEA